MPIAGILHDDARQHHLVHLAATQGIDATVCHVEVLLKRCAALRDGQQRCALFVIRSNEGIGIEVSVYANLRRRLGCHKRVYDKPIFCRVSYSGKLTPEFGVRFARHAVGKERGAYGERLMNGL